jgi:transcription initiation factor TFIID subunit TAF12
VHAGTKDGSNKGQHGRRDFSRVQEQGKQAAQAQAHQCQERISQVDAHISATARSPPPPELGRSDTLHALNVSKKHLNTPFT